MVCTGRSRSRAIRVLRVLLACAVVWLSSGSSRATSVWTDTIVLVAGPSAECPADSTIIRAPRSPLTKSNAFQPRALARRITPPSKPANTTENLVLIPDRYLNNLALLC